MGSWHVALGACGGETHKGSVTGPEPADIMVEVIFAGDCIEDCGDSLSDDDIDSGGSGDADVVEKLPLASSICHGPKANTLTKILPCKDTDKCCGTLAQYDPCAQGAKLTTAASRWQLFRFWTPESPACMGGKNVKFKLQPIMPPHETADLHGLTWAPQCPGSTSATTWTTIRLPVDGTGPSESDVTLLDVPFDQSFTPCGAARTSSTSVVALGCRSWPEFLDPVRASYWSDYGSGFCCGPANILVEIDSNKVSKPLNPPAGFNRWGIPSSIPQPAPRSGLSMDVMVPVFSVKHQDWQFGDDIPPDGWVEGLRAARISTQGPSLAIKEFVGTARADYSIGTKAVAVLDADHMAWTYDARAPQPRYGYWDGTEYAPALAMLVSGGAKEMALFEPMFDVNGWYSRALAVDDGYVVVTDHRIIQVDKTGNIMASSSVNFDDPEEGGHEFRAIGTPDGGIFTSTIHVKPDVAFMAQIRRVLRLDSKGKEVWSWKMDEPLAWAHATSLFYHNGILHVFGILVPKTNDSTWAWHLRLDAATGKELCPGQMPGKP